MDPADESLQLVELRDEPQPARPVHPVELMAQDVARAVRVLLETIDREIVQPLVSAAIAINDAVDRGVAVVDREIVQPATGVLVAAGSVIERAGKTTLDWFTEYGPLLAEVWASLKYWAELSHVENWSSLDPQQVEAAIALMYAPDGVVLAWVPPAHVVQELVAAENHSERDRVLVEHDSTIASHAHCVLSVVDVPELDELRAGTLEAWAAYGDGRFLAAQALAGVCITELVQQQLGFTKFTDASSALDAALGDNDSPEFEFLSSLRVMAVLGSLVSSLEFIRLGHPGFNRHATAHGFSKSPGQFTQVNSLRALMLATATLRELQFARADEWRKDLAPFRPPTGMPGPSLAEGVPAFGAQRKLPRDLVAELGDDLQQRARSLESEA